jgi:hypothetical protein
VMCAVVQGFFCTEGSFTSAPSFPGPPFLPVPFEYGGLCPRGGYCPAGSSAPIPCPLGTFLNSSGQSTADDCLSCTPGASVMWSASCSTAPACCLRFRGCDAVLHVCGRIAVMMAVELVHSASYCWLLLT